VISFPHNATCVKTPVAMQDAKQMDIRDNVSPLWRMPYSEQLKVKQSKCQDALYRLTAELGMCITSQRKPQWLQQALQEDSAHCTEGSCVVEVRMSLCPAEPPELRGWRQLQGKLQQVEYQQC
jgi:hypothetical protein